VVFVRSIVAVLLIVAACHAQHWMGDLTFTNTPNGTVTASVTINNADTHNSGVGTLDKFNGQSPNTPFTWERIAGNVIVIKIDGQVVAALEDVPQGQPKATEGAAELGDGTPPSRGTYKRTNAP
jgi:hypothetical protein